MPLTVTSVVCTAGAKHSPGLKKKSPASVILSKNWE